MTLFLITSIKMYSPPWTMPTCICTKSFITKDYSMSDTLVLMQLINIMFYSSYDEDSSWIITIIRIHFWEIFILVTTEIVNFFMPTSIFHMVNCIFSHQSITIFSKVLSSQIVYLDAIYTHFIKWMMLILNIKTLAFAR